CSFRRKDSGGHWGRASIVANRGSSSSRTRRAFSVGFGIRRYLPWSNFWTCGVWFFAANPEWVNPKRSRWRGGPLFPVLGVIPIRFGWLSGIFLTSRSSIVGLLRRQNGAAG